MNSSNNNNRFPAHWGDPPRMQTKDLRQLPGGYGMGSGTLAKWITEKMAADAAEAGPRPLCGGASPMDPSKDQEHTVAAAVRDTVEAHLGAQQPTWKLQGMLRQVVAGTIWYLSIRVSDDTAVHLKVLEELPHRGGGLRLLGLQHSDPSKTLAPFDNNCDILVDTTANVTEHAAPVAVLPEGGWIQLVGQHGETARQQIQGTPGVMQCVVVPEGSMVTMDYREDRVRIYVDAHGNVSRAPIRG